MVAELIQAGCAPEVAAAVVARAFASGLLSGGRPVDAVDATAEKRRAFDRERKRLQRATSTGHPVEIHPTPPESVEVPLSKDNITTISSLERGAPEKPVHRTRGTRLPDDWEPTGPDFAVAAQLLTEAGARAEVEKFRDHWKQQAGAKGVKLDWNAAWRNWFRRAAEYRGSKNGGVVQNRSDPAAGRATAREADFVARVGSTAMRWLKDRGAGERGEAPESTHIAGEPNADADPALADLEARCGAR